MCREKKNFLESDARFTTRSQRIKLVEVFVRLSAAVQNEVSPFPLFERVPSCNGSKRTRCRCAGCRTVLTYARKRQTVEWMCDLFRHVERKIRVPLGDNGKITDNDLTFVSLAENDVRSLGESKIAKEIETRASLREKSSGERTIGTKVVYSKRQACELPV